MKTVVCLLLFLVLSTEANDDWELVFRDEFTGDTKGLNKEWRMQNGPSQHILSSRWKENAVVEDGVLKLIAKKEKRGGQDWTAASLWTVREFKYGYFEARYRYAAASGTNNSFWLMTRGEPARKFEIDINEGHFPSEVNTNIHNWTGTHWDKSETLTLPDSDMSKTFHIFGLLWTKSELVWYVDGKEVRREKNTIFHGKSPVRLSLAIVSWAGEVTDKIHGTAMEVDYVRVYKPSSD